MITITEVKYLDGTGDIVKDVEYPKYDNYKTLPNGDLIIWRTDKDKVTTIEETYYVSGAFRKIYKS